MRVTHPSAAAEMANVISIDLPRTKEALSDMSLFPGSATDNDIRALLSLASSDLRGARERFPGYRLTRLVLSRLDMNDAEASVFSDLTRATDSETLQVGIPFNGHLRVSIKRFGLTALFCEDGPGRDHQAIRPTGYDYCLDAADANAMEQWRADYRAMSPARQMFAATIIWLYRAGKDSRWLRRVPCTWHAADALAEMHRSNILADWGTLVSLYPGW